MNRLKAVLRWLVGDYQIYRVLELDRVDLIQQKHASSGLRLRPMNGAQEISAAADSGIRAQAAYAAPEAACFVADSDGSIVAVCWFWYGETYLRRNFWPLRTREAKLVQIQTAAEYRNLGIAQDLLRYACAQMFDAGFTRLYARIWHSNTPSLAAFAKVGWREIAFVIDIEPLGKRLRFCKRQGIGPSLYLLR